MNPKQIREAQAARDAALTTPTVVRDAMLIAPVKSRKGITLQPYCIGILWLLADIKSPLMDMKFLAEAARKSGGNFPIDFKDLARAIFVFSDPDGAFGAYQEDKETLSVFDQQAFAIARRLLPADIPVVLNHIVQVIGAGMSTAPVPPGDDAAKKKQSRAPA